MSTDPTQVSLSPEQQQFLAEIADQAGKPWTIVFSEALEQYRVQYAQEGGRKPKARFGSGKGLVSMASDCDAPLADFENHREWTRLTDCSWYRRRWSDLRESALISAWTGTALSDCGSFKLHSASRPCSSPVC